MKQRSTTPSASTVFLARRLEARDESRFWLAMTLFLGAVASTAYIFMALHAPIGLPNDARQFLSWMGRWDDASLLRGDLVADYWQSVTPWFHQATYRLAWAIGLAPIVFVKLLPALLYPLLALFSFRFLRAIGAEPLVAFLTTALLIYYFTQDDPMVSGSPRAFWPFCLLAILDGLARMRIFQTVLAQLMLAGCYPQMTLVTSTLIGFTMVDVRRAFLLDLSGRRVALVGAAAAATAIGLLPFILETDRFAPVVTLEQARHIPTFGFTGRNRIFETDGSMNFLCGRRLGMFGIKCKGYDDPKLYIFATLAALGPIVLFLRVVRPGRKAKIRSVLPFHLLIASLIWFALSIALLLRLHLPSRYSSTLLPLAILTVPPLMLEFVRNRPFPRWLVERQWGRAMLHGGTFAVLALAIVGAASVRWVMRSPKDPALIETIRAMPQTGVVAGFVDDLDFSPVETDRSTLFNRALAIGYQLGYLRPVLERMEDMRDVTLTNDRRILAERLSKNGVTLLLVEPKALDRPRVPDAFRGFFPVADLAAAEAEAAANGPTALSRLAPDCVTRRFDTVLALDATCLIKAANRQ